MQTTTFLATAPRRLNAAKIAKMRALVRKCDDKRFWISSGTPERNQPAYTLCFDGPREYAEEEVIAEFRRITAP